VTDIRHEAGHALIGKAGIGSEQIAGGFGEGIAVYLAGGHYKPEPLPERAAALHQLGDYIPITRLLNNFGTLQHESRYLEVAGIVAYIVEEYGWESWTAIARVVLDPVPASSSSWFDGALKEVLDITLEDFESEFVAWLESKDPGSQLDDLRLTIALQEVRRRYQLAYALYPLPLGGISATAVEPPTIYIREADSPTHIAIETMLAAAQEAIIAGRYDEAEALIPSLDELVDTWDFSAQPASDYLEIAEMLAVEGYEAIAISIEGDEARVTASIAPPELETILFERVDGQWRLED